MLGFSFGFYCNIHGEVQIMRQKNTGMYGIKNKRIRIFLLYCVLSLRGLRGLEEGFNYTFFKCHWNGILDVIQILELHFGRKTQTLDDRNLTTKYRGR